MKEEIPYAFGFAGECMMCKIGIGPDDSRTAIYEQAEGRKREYIGILCPTCAKIGKNEIQERKSPSEGLDIVRDIELLIRIYDLGLKYAEKHKIKVQPDDMMKAAITTFIESRRR